MTDTEIGKQVHLIMLEVTDTAIFPITDNEDAADRLYKAGMIVKRAREIQAMMTDLVMDWIDEHGEFELGDARYYNGKAKSTKAKDHAAVLRALKDAHKGNVSKIAGYLASGAWKHGAIRELLGDDEFAELFEVTEQRDLKTGKPKRKPQAVAKRFLPDKA